MSTYVQSESSNPTAKDLLNLLQQIESQPDGDELLRQPFCYWDDEVGGYTTWLGRLDIGEDDDDLEGIGLSFLPNDTIEAAHRKMREEATLREAERRAAHPTPVELEVRRAREAGLLP